MILWYMICNIAHRLYAHYEHARLYTASRSWPIPTCASTSHMCYYYHKSSQRSLFRLEANQLSWWQNRVSKLGPFNWKLWFYDWQTNPVSCFPLNVLQDNSFLSFHLRTLLQDPKVWAIRVCLSSSILASKNVFQEKKRERIQQRS